MTLARFALCFCLALSARGWAAAPLNCRQPPIRGPIDAAAFVPKGAKIVTGAPGERLYLHLEFPGTAAGSSASGSSGYLVSGDRVAAGDACGTWTSILYQGKKRAYVGWVESARLAEVPDGAPTPASAVSNPPKPLPPACAEAARKLDDWLTRPEASRIIFPSALTDSVSVDKFPEGIDSESAGFAWSIEIADAHIHGKLIKAVSYASGGTCHDQSLELWDPALKAQILIPTGRTDPDTNYPTDPGDATGYSSEELAELRGNPYFVHIPRSVDHVKLYRITPELKAIPACEIERVPAEKETLSSAADPQLCAAVLRGDVEDAGLEAKAPSPLDEETSVRLLSRFAFGGREVSIVAMGKADPHNDGALHRVAMLDFQYSDGAGCGHDRSYQWPAILDDHEQPTQSVDDDSAFPHAGGTSRLIKYNGVTYFDTRTDDPMDGLPSHEVWKLSQRSAIQMCKFIPVRYKPMPVPP